MHRNIAKANSSSIICSVEKMRSLKVSRKVLRVTSTPRLKRRLRRKAQVCRRPTSSRLLVTTKSTALICYCWGVSAWLEDFYLVLYR